MPKISNDLQEVLAGDDTAVLGDALTVQEPKRLRHQARQRRRRYYNPISPLSGSLGSMGVETALVASPPAGPPVEAEGERHAWLAVLPGAASVVSGAVKGGLYGAFLGNGSTERRIGGGAIAGAVSFPALTMLAGYVKLRLAGSQGVEHPIVGALLDDAAHVGGATASVAAAGGEATDGALAGAAVVVASHLLNWIVGR
jgi:hypothetical protein